MGGNIAECWSVAHAKLHSGYAKRLSSMRNSVLGAGEAPIQGAKPYLCTTGNHLTTQDDADLVRAQMHAAGYVIAGIFA